jgi:hypothetical protein
MNINYNYLEDNDLHEVFINDKKVGHIRRPAGMSYYWFQSKLLDDIMLEENLKKSKAMVLMGQFIKLISK